uniref:DUF19 domain-containing protein n=1 Tax=Caenorhabditis japonica TaxID=281687 RepID=A0A8R1DZ37_CAEJA
MSFAKFVIISAALLVLTHAANRATFKQRAAKMSNKIEDIDTRTSTRTDINEAVLFCQQQAKNQTAKISEETIIYCNFLNFYIDKFEKCGEKVDAKHSDCADNWNLFSEDSYDTEVECDEFFGADDCIRWEIAETCGEKAWAAFRDHILPVKALFCE